MPWPFHLPWFDLHSNYWKNVQIMKTHQTITSIKLLHPTLTSMYSPPHSVQTHQPTFSAVHKNMHTHQLQVDYAVLVVPLLMPVSEGVWQPLV